VTALSVTGRVRQLQSDRFRGGNGQRSDEFSPPSRRLRPLLELGDIPPTVSPESECLLAVAHPSHARAALRPLLQKRFVSLSVSENQLHCRHHFHRHHVQSFVHQLWQHFGQNLSPHSYLSDPIRPRRPGRSSPARHTELLTKLLQRDLPNLGHALPLCILSTHVFGECHRSTSHRLRSG